MHGCGSGSPFLVNAEVDSMGGVVDGGVGIGIKTSPRRAAIEKAQAELRQEYDVREERRRELEFLEKGGNPLDFKFGNAASVSVQSTSLTDHHAEQFVTSEAKGSFALTASPRGDSVESSDRPLVPVVCEPSSADNFHGDTELLERDRKHLSRRNNVVPSEQSSQMDGTPNVKESEDSAIVHSYARRNRSRTNRDGTRSSSKDFVQSSSGHGSSLQVRASLRESKGLKSEIKNLKDQNTLSASDLKTATSNGDMIPLMENFKSQSNKELDGVGALETKVDLPKNNLPDDRLDVLESKNLMDKPHHQDSKIDAHKTPVGMIAGESDYVEVKEQVIAGVPGVLPSAGTGKIENETSSALLNGFSDSKRNGNMGWNGTAALGVKGLHSESSCTEKNVGLDVNHESDLCVTRKINETNGVTQQMPELDGTQNLDIGKSGNEQNEAKAVESDSVVSDKNVSVHENHSNNGSFPRIEEEVQRTSDLRNEVKCPNNYEVEQKVHTMSEADKEVVIELGDDSDPRRDCPGGIQVTLDCSKHEITESKQSEKNCAASDPLSCSVSELKLVDRDHEDFILEEARIIEAKHKRIAELSICTQLSEGRRMSHWDFVLEEMTWLANDFAQERLWKMTSAAQICRRVAFTSRFSTQNQQLNLKKIACTLAKAVMQFWNSAELLTNNDDHGVVAKNCKHDSGRFDGRESSRDKMGEPHQEKCKQLAIQNPSKNFALAIKEYAVKFLRCNSSPIPPMQAEVPATPERVSDLGIMEVSWDDQLTEESLFYVVPSGAMETYRTSIESHFAQCKKIVSGVQEEVDTSMYDGAADFGYHENAYDEEEGETNAYYLHGGFEGSKSKHDQKKQKKFVKSYSARSYDLGAELPYGHSSVGCRQSILMGKRPGSNMHVGPVPPKRMRTASRQRFISPFSAGTPLVGQIPAKTDVSSGDTSSLQDDQTTLRGGSQIQKSMEVESVGEFEKQVPYDCAETSLKLKKKKKAKTLGSTYEQGWQLESAVYNEQRDNLKKRQDGYQFESNGTSGLHGQHPAKKTKIMKHSLENTFENMAPVTGSIPSPAASQMSNMSNTKFMKIIARDRGNKKAKSLKISAGEPGSGSPWSSFEDQALVVLVHDMGPNWELVSDAINNTLQFKCIFRKPKECKERHKILMDKGAGDGADSAEDSGSSQSYPLTLPGIPKGSARQLFQRLQGPMEEDMLKSHFEKIIMIGKKQHCRNQNDNQDPKQLAAVHNSHVVALSQACPNNLGGVVLTPLDLCDANTSNPDVLSLGYHGSQASGLAMPNQGAMSSILPTSGANSPMQGSSSMILGNSSPMQSGVINTSSREARYNVARPSLPIDEQQRLQNYNQMLATRNLQQPNLPVSGTLSGTDRGIRVLPGGNGIGMVPGMNRSMPVSRPGFQGMHSSPMLNSGSMLSSSMGGMSSAVNVHPSGQGNSIRPHETFNTMRPSHNPEHQRPMMVPELQMQVSHENSQGIPAFNGLSSAFANQTTPPVQTYPGHPQQQHQVSSQPSHVLGTHHPHLEGPNHGTGSAQQAYAIRLAKERQMRQRLLQQQQQQQQFANSSALMPNNQLARSSSMQNNSQVQPSNSQQPVSLSPLTPSSPMTQISVQQQKIPHHGLSRNPQTGVGGLANLTAKQRQRQQQLQQPGRQHPQQRQHSQSLQQANLVKGMGRGNMMAHQNVSIDHPHPNGLSVPVGSQGAEKGEEMMNLMQGPGLYSAANLNPNQPSKALLTPQTSNNSQPHQKVFSGSAPPESSKQLQQIPSASDRTQGHVPTISSGQTVPTQMMVSNHQHLQQSPTKLNQKQISQAQSNIQGMLQQNHQLNSDLPTKPQTDRVRMDQQSLQNISQMASSTALPMPQACNDSTSSAPVSMAIPQWKASEPLYDSCLPNPVSQVGSIGSPPLINSAGIEIVPSVSQGLGQRHSSGSFGQHGLNAAAQWQHQQQHPSNHSTILPQSSQQVFQSQEQQLPQEQKCSPAQLPQHQLSHQTSHPQSAQGNMYMRSSNS